MVFRIATMKDLSAVQSCIRAAFEPYISVLQAQPYALSVDFSQLIEAAEIYVLEEESASSLIGTVRLSLRGHYVELANMAVTPIQQKRGFGRQLLKDAETLAKSIGAKEIRLSTNSLLVDLLSFYQNNKYQESHREQRADRTLVFFSKII